MHRQHQHAGLEAIRINVGKYLSAAEKDSNGYKSIKIKHVKQVVGKIEEFKNRIREVRLKINEPA